MTETQAIQKISGEAGVDLSAKQYYFVTMSSDGQFDPTGDGALADGVLMSVDTANVGAACSIAIGGVVPVVAGDAITRGDLVSSDAAGKANTAATNDEILGRAMKGAAAGDVFPVLLKLSGRAPKP